MELIEFDIKNLLVNTLTTYIISFIINKSEDSLIKLYEKSM